MRRADEIDTSQTALTPTDERKKLIEARNEKRRMALLESKHACDVTESFEVFFGDRRNDRDVWPHHVA